MEKAGSTGKAIVTRLDSPWPGACVVAMESPAVPADAAAGLHIEGVFTSWGFERTWPFCHFDALEEQTDGRVLTCTGRGRLDQRDDRPFTLRLRCVAEPERVRFEGEFTALSDEMHMNSVCPCLSAPAFARTNHPPFEMARRSFIFSVGKGLRWISDAERIWGEHQETEDGPYMQLFPTADHLRDLAAGKANRKRLPSSWGTPHETAAAPLVGWIGGDSEYLIAVGWENGYQTGIRWGPCLHCDPSTVLPTGEPTRRFRGVVYILPADLDALVERFVEDFGERYRKDLRRAPGALWPYRAGRLLDGMEGASLHEWRTAGSRVAAYESQNNLWTNGHTEQTFFPEGVTEGRGSMVWEIPAGEGEASLSRTVRPTEALTHVALDAVHRGEEAADVRMSAQQRGREIGAETFRIHPGSNRRLLLSVKHCDGRSDVTIELITCGQGRPLRLVLDNLRGFTASEQRPRNASV